MNLSGDNNNDEITKGADGMNNTAYAILDMDLIRSKKTKYISSEEALKDVVPIEWTDEVLSGKKKVELTLEK